MATEEALATALVTVYPILASAQQAPINEQELAYNNAV